MAEDDLARFLDKVDQLQRLVSSLDAVPQRRQQLSDCNDHNAVVSLARQWGFEIGRRWGDANPPSARAGNLLSEPLPDQGAESERVLLSTEQWRLVLIQSNDYKSPEGEWMVQRDAEWVLLLRGSAELSFRGPEERIDLSVGDPVLIAPQRPHRVERTDPDPGTLWLALIWTSSGE